MPLQAKTIPRTQSPPSIARPPSYGRQASRGGACNDPRAALSVSKTAPLRTLGAAAKLAQPEDLVRVRAALYNEVQKCSGCDGRAVLQPIKPGTQLKWIRFVAEPEETVVLVGSAAATIGVRIVPVNGAPPSFTEVQLQAAVLR